LTWSVLTAASFNSSTYLIVNWWVDLLDDQNLKQDGGYGSIGAIADWSRSKANSLTDEERQTFIDRLTEFLLDWDETELIKLHVDYEPEDYLADVVKSCGDCRDKIRNLLPIKTLLQYKPSGEILGRIGYNGQIQALEIN
jgi:hypothetical protein